MVHGGQPFLFCWKRDFFGTPYCTHTKIALEKVLNKSFKLIVHVWDPYYGYNFFKFWILWSFYLHTLLVSDGHGQNALRACCLHLQLTGCPIKVDIKSRCCKKLNLTHSSVMKDTSEGWGSWPVPHLSQSRVTWAFTTIPRSKKLRPSFRWCLMITVASTDNALMTTSLISKSLESRNEN